jgi:hypothetical protein
VDAPQQLLQVVGRVGGGVCCPRDYVCCQHAGFSGGKQRRLKAWRLLARCGLPSAQTAWCCGVPAHGSGVLRRVARCSAGHMLLASQCPARVRMCGGVCYDGCGTPATRVRVIQRVGGSETGTRVQTCVQQLTPCLAACQLLGWGAFKACQGPVWELRVQLGVALCEV